MNSLKISVVFFNVSKLDTNWGGASWYHLDVHHLLWLKVDPCFFPLCFVKAASLVTCTAPIRNRRVSPGKSFTVSRWMNQCQTPPIWEEEVLRATRVTQNYWSHRNTSIHCILRITWTSSLRFQRLHFHLLVTISLKLHCYRFALKRNFPWQSGRREWINRQTFIELQFVDCLLLCAIGITPLQPLFNNSSSKCFELAVLNNI